MQRDKGVVYIAVICVFTGLLLAWLLKAGQAQALNPARRNEDLVNVIKGVENETAALEERIAALRQSLDDRQKDGLGGQDQLKLLRREVSGLREDAGLTELEGPGVTVVLDDNVAGAQAAKNANPAAFNPENFIIHDKNVLYIVNDLRAGGAEAIAVNNQRITSTSDIRCVGTVILINSTRLAPPYEIKAIGDPDRLEVALQNGQDYPYLKLREFPVRLTKMDHVTIPAYKGSYRFSYATPVQDPAGGED